MAPARTAFVTSAARGLARGIVIDLARAGYRVAFTYRPGGTGPEETLAAAVAVTDPGLPAPLAIAADHDAAGETERSILVALNALGTIDGYVHAVGPIVVKSFADSTAGDFRAMIDGNVQSAVEGARAVLPGMRARKHGRLIFFGMNGSHITLPAAKMSLYGAAKAAVVAFARTLALEEAANGITVNVVEPGDIRNKTADREQAREIPANNPTGHAGSWEDISYAVKFLLAPEAGFINGQTLAVNGGLVAAHE